MRGGHPLLLLDLATVLTTLQSKTGRHLRLATVPCLRFLVAVWVPYYQLWRCEQVS